MKKPRPIKAVAVVKKTQQKLSVLEVFHPTDMFDISPNEKKCQVEIKFIKWLK